MKDHIPKRPFLTCEIQNLKDFRIHVLVVKYGRKPSLWTYLKKNYRAYFYFRTFEKKIQKLKKVDFFPLHFPYNSCTNPMQLKYKLFWRTFYQSDWNMSSKCPILHSMRTSTAIHTCLILLWCFNQFFVFKSLSEFINTFKMAYFALMALIKEQSKKS